MKTIKNACLAFLGITIATQSVLAGVPTNRMNVNNNIKLAASKISCNKRTSEAKSIESSAKSPELVGSSQKKKETGKFLVDTQADKKYYLTESYICKGKINDSDQEFKDALSDYLFAELKRRVYIKKYSRDGSLFDETNSTNQYIHDLIKELASIEISCNKGTLEAKSLELVGSSETGKFLVDKKADKKYYLTGSYICKGKINNSDQEFEDALIDYLFAELKRRVYTKKYSRDGLLFDDTNSTNQYNRDLINSPYFSSYK